MVVIDGVNLMRKTPYILAYMFFFGAGAYAWKVQSRRSTKSPSELLPVKGGATAKLDVTGLSSGVIVTVGNESINQEDVDWEYRQQIEGVLDREALTPIPDLGEKYNQELGTLRRALVSSLIERKLLFAFLKQDHQFEFDKPSRYSACLAEWQQAVAALNANAGRADRERLKTSLCERSVLNQYMEERLFADIKIEESEALDYYKSHQSEFKRPERVLIRHLLAPSEAVAKMLKAHINPANFETLARQHSIAPEAANGGLIGPFPKGSMPPVFEVAFHQKPGEISDLLKSNYGYHLIMLLNRYPKQQLAFVDMKGQIVKKLRAQKEAERFTKWVDQALAAINISSPKTTW